MELLLPIGELFKKSFQTYKTKAWKLAGAVLINLVYIPLFLLVSAPIGYAVISQQQGRPVGVGWYGIIALTVLVAVAVGVIVSSWASAAMLLLIKGTAASSQEALRLGWPKVPSLAWIGFLGGMAIALGMLALIIPGIIFAIWFSFAMVMHVIEGHKGTQALKASKALVSGRFWAVLGRLIILWLLFLAVGMIFRNFVGQLINMFVITPFSLVYLYVLYEDLKKAKSPLDATQ